MTTNLKTKHNITQAIRDLGGHFTAVDLNKYMDDITPVTQCGRVKFYSEDSARLAIDHFVSVSKAKYKPEQKVFGIAAVKHNEKLDTLHSIERKLDLILKSFGIEA